MYIVDENEKKEMKISVRRMHGRGQDQYPTVKYECNDIFKAACLYCRENGFETPFEMMHSTGDVYTILSRGLHANVIGKFHIYQE